LEEVVDEIDFSEGTTWTSMNLRLKEQDWVRLGSKIEKQKFAFGIFTNKTSLE